MSGLGPAVQLSTRWYDMKHPQFERTEILPLAPRVPTRLANTYSRHNRELQNAIRDAVIDCLQEEWVKLDRERKPEYTV
jgi:hypothetical protein